MTDEPTHLPSLSSGSPPQLVQRLRGRPVERPFHVILVEPEIPPNTGNVARLCAATHCPLHLVGKLGFRIDEHAVRRAGLDYWHLVELHLHETLEAAEQAISTQGQLAEPAHTWLLSGRSKRSYLDVSYRLGDCFVFGKESVGLPDELLERRESDTLGIPMLGEVRSHNLANAVAIVLYEALRQTGCLELDQRR